MTHSGNNSVDRRIFLINIGKIIGGFALGAGFSNDVHASFQLQWKASRTELSNILFEEDNLRYNWIPEKLGSSSAHWYYDDQEYLSLGDPFGTFSSFKNEGTSDSPNWSSYLVFNGLDIGDASIPNLKTIGNDLYLVSGDLNGIILAYKNQGTDTFDWVQSSRFDSIESVGLTSAPEAVVLKSDSKERWIIGSYANGFDSRVNSGTKDDPVWEKDNRFDGIANPGSTCKPAHGYIDGEEYLAFGIENGTMLLYKNSGTEENPAWGFENILPNFDIGEDAAPEFIKDKDGKVEGLLVGSRSGVFKYFKINDTSTSIDDHVQTPHEFKLYQNYPNPFNPNTTIVYELQKAEKISIALYNVKGQLVRQIKVDEMQPAGMHQIEFNAKNLASGIYLLNIRAGNYSQTQKMTIVK